MSSSTGIQQKINAIKTGVYLNRSASIHYQHINK